jgi:hypothetical protein
MVLIAMTVIVPAKPALANQSGLDCTNGQDAAIDMMIDESGSANLIRVQPSAGPMALCFAVSSCVWHLPPIAGLDFVGHVFDTCNAAPQWRHLSSGAYISSRECKTARPGFGVVGRLISSALSSVTPSCPASTGMSGFLISAPSNTSVIVLQFGMTNPDGCLIVTNRVTDGSIVALFETQCFVNEAQWRGSRSASVLATSLSRVQVLGAERGSMGFSATITSSTTSALGVTEPIDVWGNWSADGNKYVREWLKHVIAAANSPQPTVQVEHDPFQTLSDSTTLGKLSRWLIAGISRSADVPFVGPTTAIPQGHSREIRNWMAIQELSNAPEYAGTFLRSENARTEWK